MKKLKTVFLTLVLMFSINTLHARNIGDVSIETIYGKYTIEEKLNDYNEKLETTGTGLRLSYRFDEKLSIEVARQNYGTASNEEYEIYNNYIYLYSNNVIVKNDMVGIMVEMPVTDKFLFTTRGGLSFLEYRTEYVDHDDSTYNTYIVKNNYGVYFNLGIKQYLTQNAYIGFDFHSTSTEFDFLTKTLGLNVTGWQLYTGYTF